jgi:hypothetical protein
MPSGVLAINRWAETEGRMESEGQGMVPDDQQPEIWDQKGLAKRHCEKLRWGEE